MSSAVVSTPAALRRPFIFDDETDPQVGTAALGCPIEHSSTATHAAHYLPGDVARHDSRGRLSPLERLIQSTPDRRFPPSSITPASRLEIRPAPEMASSGIPDLDALTGGLPRGCLTEICGTASSGRTTVLLAALAAASRRSEYCALIDASDALDPHSVAAAGVDLDRLLWVRCGDDPPKNNTPKHTRDGCPILAESFAARVGISPQSAFNLDMKRLRTSERCLEQVLRATDLLLESGGFGLILLDLADLPPQTARRIPLTTWFRFRRAIENKPTILLAIEQQPIAGSCSSLLLQLGALSARQPALASKESVGEQVADCQRTVPRAPTHAQLLTGLEINVELIRSRLERKPARSATFETKTAWAG